MQFNIVNYEEHALLAQLVGPQTKNNNTKKIDFNWDASSVSFPRHTPVLLLLLLFLLL